METKRVAGMTLEHLAILLDGTGNIPDELAALLAPLFRADPRFAEALDEFQKMARDAGTRYLADGLDAYQSFHLLQAKAWEHPHDVLDPDIDIPYAELISIAAARAERAPGKAKAELLELGQRLERSAADDLAKEFSFHTLTARLLEVGDQVAGIALRQLLEQYRERCEDSGELLPNVMIAENQAAVMASDSEGEHRGEA